MPASDSAMERTLVWRTLDWGIVGGIISSFPLLMKAIIGLESREDVIAFDDVAKVHMPRLHSSGMFRYALWDPDGINQWDTQGTWLRAYPGSASTEGMLRGLTQHLMTDCLPQHLSVLNGS